MGREESFLEALRTGKHDGVKSDETQQPRGKYPRDDERRRFRGDGRGVLPEEISPEIDFRDALVLLVGVTVAAVAALSCEQQRYSRQTTSLL
jgi:hypothetical protein